MLEALKKRNQDIIDKVKELKKLKDLSAHDQLMFSKNSRKIGTILCSILRHGPERIGVKMEADGAWVNVDELIEKFNASQKNKVYLNLGILLEIVRTDEKTRYGLQLTKENTLKIRCNQGHSIAWIHMNYKVETPPEILYHGTSRGFLDSIMKEGLKPMSRQKVHISADYETAVKVGNRKKKQGETVVLQVDAGQMVRDGGVFYLAENGVWLADAVPAKYLCVKSWNM